MAPASPPTSPLPSGGGSPRPVRAVPLLRVLIVDDEPIARDGLRAMLAAVASVDVVGEAGTGPEAVAAIRRLDPDLVFLDVEIPELDGFAVLAELGERRSVPDGEAALARPIVIFVTAYDRYAIRAFEVRALDYVLKPFGPPRIAEAIARTREQLRLGHAASLRHSLTGVLETLRGREAPEPADTSRPPLDPPADIAVDRLAVRVGSRTVFVDTADVNWIEGADDYARVHARGRRYLLDQRLASLERRLDGRRFIRVHRSAIVNAARVRELFPLAHGDSVAILDDGTRVRVSRSRRDAVIRRLSGRG